MLSPERAARGSPLSQPHTRVRLPGMARRCAFCGGSGLTREHVIPRWLDNVLPEQARYRGQDQATVLLHPERMIDGPHHREMVETFNSTTVKAVCGPCNNGFMNDIEADARPYLSAMIRGNLAMSLAAEGVTAVATWAVKTSLMAQLTGSEPAALEQVYGDFYATRRPTPECMVWAAAVDDQDWALRTECRLMLYALDGQLAGTDDPPNILSVTIGLGALLLHTLVDPVLGKSTWNLTSAFRGALVPFWPDPRPVTWPPRFLHPGEAWGVCEYMPLLLS
jgi:hypothetical protein